MYRANQPILKLARFACIPATKPCAGHSFRTQFLRTAYDFVSPPPEVAFCRTVTDLKCTVRRDGACQRRPAGSA
jgi:hypothetical protein